MKKFLTSIVICFLTTVTLYTNAQYISGAKFCSDRKSAMKNLPVLKSSENIPPHTFDVQDYKLEIKLYDNYFTPYPHNFNAVNTVTFLVDSTLSCISLNASNASIVVDAVENAGVSFTHTGNILNIQLDRVYNPGETASVKIKYHHLNVDDYAFYVNSGFVFTDCEPEGARRWMPCWDKPSDKATWEVYAKVPTQVKLGSNGKLIDSTFNADTLTYHWKSIHPVSTYLIVLTSKMNYNLDIVYWHKLSNPADSVPIRFYYNNGEYPYVMESIIDDLTTWYSQSFCEHPFEKNGFATLNNEFYWGGMENQTLTSLCPGCWSENLLAHEFAHQWFGDMNTCATWADIWVNEGFATWCEARWYEKDNGYTGYKALIDEDAGSYFSGISTAPWAIYNPSWAVVTPDQNTLFNYSVTYAKGSCALHQIRYLLGDSLFFKVMNAYSEKPGMKYNSNRIADFFSVVDSVTGTNYDWYYEDWISQKYHPTYNNSYQFIDEGSGQWKVKYFTRQTQTNTGFFRMVQEIKIRFADNTDTTFRFFNDVNYQQLEWMFSKEPVDLTFDPDNEIVLKTANTYVGIGEPGADFITGLTSIPNPVIDKTTIRYSISGESAVKLVISDMSGKVVAVPVNTVQSAGEHSTVLNCSSFAPGIYTCKLIAGKQTQVRKIVVTR